MEASVSAAHQVAERVRFRILETYSAVSEVLVHVDCEANPDVHLDSNEAREILQDEETSLSRSHNHSHSPLSSDNSHSHSHSHSQTKNHDHPHDHPHHNRSHLDNHKSSHPRSKLHNKKAMSKEEKLELVRNKFMRPQSQIKHDVEQVLKQPEFKDIRGISHFTCHFLTNRLTVQLELILDPDLTIHQAANIARDVRAAVAGAVPDVQDVDVHLELESHDNK